MKSDRFLGMLGLCARARKLTAGSALSSDAIARGAYLAIVSSDAADNTRKRINDKCSFYGCRCLEAGFTSAEIGYAIGKSGTVAAVAVNDPNFADALVRLCGVEE